MSTQPLVQQGRLAVLKTYKLYIGGAFPRSESGRYLRMAKEDGTFMGNLCRASRKVFREAVVVARKAQHGWAGRTAFNRAQIIYRMAEMLEGRREGLTRVIVDAEGRSAAEANAEVDASIDRLVYYAGWCDKFEQVFGGTNPVASGHFNVSMIEALGVVTILSSKNTGLLGLISTVAPVIAMGNAAIVVVEGAGGFAAIELAEVLATSDLPGGVINILTGMDDELLPFIASHGDNDGVFGVGLTPDEQRLVGEKAADTVKRTFLVDDRDAAGWLDTSLESPWWISPFVEVKTAWHPLGT